MASGELLISHINSVQLYTYQYLTYISTPAKYTVRDLDFRAGSARYVEVVSNIDMTDEDKESVIASLDYIDFSHLDLPTDYRAMLDAVIPIPKVCTHVKSDFEYAGVKLACATRDFLSYFRDMGVTPMTIVLTDIIKDLGTGDLPQERACLSAISELLKTPSLDVKLSKVLGYTSAFNVEFSTYVATQLLQFLYLSSLYSSFKTDSHKPNDLPYIAIRN